MAGVLLGLVATALMGSPTTANELDRAFVTQVDLRPQGGDRQPRPNLNMNVLVRIGNCPAGRPTCVDEPDAYQVQLLVGAGDRIAVDQVNEIRQVSAASTYIAELGNLGVHGIGEGDSIRARARARNPAGWSDWTYSDRAQVLANSDNARLSSNITPPRIAAAGAGARLITPETNRISVNLGEWRQPDVASAVSSIGGSVMYCTDAECNLSNDMWNIGLREGWGRTLRNDRACCGSAAVPTYTIDVDIQDNWTGFRVRSKAINAAGSTQYVVSDVFPILGRGAAAGPRADDITPPEYTPQRGRVAEFLGEPVVGSWLFVFPGTWSSTINEATRISYSIYWHSCAGNPNNGGYAAAGCEQLLDGLVNQFLLRPVSNDLWTRYVYACVVGRYADREISPGYRYESACLSPVQIRAGVPQIDPAAIPPVPDELLDPGAAGGAVAQPGQVAADPLAEQAEQLAAQGQAAGAEAQAAAAGINVAAAPVLGVAGTATRDGLTLRMSIPQEQKRGLKRKKQRFRAFVSSRLATGKVRFTLTRLTPKGKLVIGKTKTVSLKKAKGQQRRGVIRWKFALKKPIGNHTVYATYLPSKKAQQRGFEGLTAAQAMRLT